MSYIKITPYSQGLGNKLFKYVYANILSKELDGIPIYHDALPEFGIQNNYHKLKGNKLKTITITNYHTTLNKPQQNVNYILSGGGCGLAENYLIYKPHLQFIRTLFPKVDKTNTTDLCIHLRGGNVWVNEIIYDLPPTDSWKELLSRVKYNNIYIVTNIKITQQWTLIDIHNLKNSLKKHGGDGDKSSDYKNPNYKWANEQFCLKRINSVLTYLNSLNSIWITNDELIKDFNFIRSFDKIVICASTFAWWAALLTDAAEIYTYKPWKSIKGKKNKNFGLTDYENWHQWG